MRPLAFVLNIPWTFVGLLYGLLSLPRRIKLNKNPAVVVVNVKRLWLGEILLGRRIKGTTVGNTVLLSDVADSFTYSHEIAHVAQFEKRPLILPVLYGIETTRRGYRENKYEKEARQKSGESE